MGKVTHGIASFGLVNEADSLCLGNTFTFESSDNCNTFCRLVHVLVHTGVLFAHNSPDFFLDGFSVFTVIVDNSQVPDHYNSEPGLNINYDCYLGNDVDKLVGNPF
jgi:hypothetical protein